MGLSSFKRDRESVCARTHLSMLWKNGKKKWKSKSKFIITNQPIKSTTYPNNNVILEISNIWIGKQQQQLSRFQIIQSAAKSVRASFSSCPPSFCLSLSSLFLATRSHKSIPTSHNSKLFFSTSHYFHSPCTVSRFKEEDRSGSLFPSFGHLHEGYSRNASVRLL